TQRRGFAMSSPPPRSPLPPSGKMRRRPAPPLTGGWIWLVVIGLFVGAWLLTYKLNAGTIDYSDFVKMVEDPELNKHLTKLTFVGSDEVYGEVDQADDLPPELKGKLSGNFFRTILIPKHNPELIKKLDALANDKDHHLTILRQPDYFGWLGPFLLMLLPAL